MGRGNGTFRAVLPTFWAFGASKHSETRESAKEIRMGVLGGSGVFS